MKVVLVFAAGMLCGALLWLGAMHRSSASLGAKSPAVSEIQSVRPLPASARIPILVYHIVRPAYPNDSRAVRATSVTPEVFQQQMAYLKTAGYTVVPLSAVENYFYNGVPLPPHPIVITIDDGWEDQYRYALPILVRYRYTATFFVPTNWVGANKSFVTWEQLKEMQADGMTIGDHSRSHIPLAGVTSQELLASELVASKKILEERLGTAVNEFDYPYGSFSTTTARAVEAAGYKLARTELFGYLQSKDTLFTMRAINAPTTIEKFITYLQFKYKG